MNWCYRRSCAFFALAISVVLLTKGVMLADPPAENCVTKTCEEGVWFIESPDLRCYTFEKAECAWCFQGRCVSSGPTQPFCKKNATKQVFLWPWQLGTACAPKCDLPLNSYSEATEPQGKFEAGAFVPKHDCSATP
ncbi:MAG: hypothetical protein L0241_11120 [Planctomycetia bacterium]|nr:hypothetical protein [Planctomycetia bacterium]